MFYGKVVVYVFPTPSEQFLRRQVDLCGVKLPSTYVEYDFGRLPCKNRTASGDFFSAKMHSTEKSVFFDDFLRA